MPVFRKKSREVIKCQQCGNEFVKTNYNQKYCSKECRNDHGNDIKAAAINIYRELNKKNEQTKI